MQTKSFKGNLVKGLALERYRCSISSDLPQMKGRGIDLRDSNGHLLPH